MTAKLYFSGTTHTTSGPQGAAVSRDGLLDIKLPEPHPAAEDLFAAAWSACYLGAIGLAAAQRKIKLPSPPAVDTEIQLLHGGATTGFFLKARLDVSLPGIDKDVARTIVDAAHEVCPYSKAVHGNIEIETNVIDNVELNAA